MSNIFALLKCYFEVALEAVKPKQCLPYYLPQNLPVHTSILAIGKGAYQWAMTLEQLCYQHPDWSQAHQLTGCVVTPHGQGGPHSIFEVFEASHPLPDHHGLHASQRLLTWAQQRKSDELVLAIVTGGGSALLPAPIAPLVLQDEIDLHQALLSCGASIHEINTVRIQVSQIKGGRLASTLSNQHLINYIVSDIPGDQIEWVSSGPTIPTQSTFKDAWDIIEKYRILTPRFQLSDRLIRWFNQQRSKNTEIPTNISQQIDTYMVASSSTALQRLQAYIQDEQKIYCMITHEHMEGNAQVAGKNLAQHALETYAMMSIHTELVLLSGGEVTVNLSKPPQGRGGPNSELALAFAKEIQGHHGVYALFADTDGIDGYGGHAGAYVDAHSWQNMIQQKIDPEFHLENHASYEAFERINMLFLTGPTGSNVNDLRVIYLKKT